MDCRSIEGSSSSQIIWKHDVFVSFRGEDTRNNFVDHLFAALHRRGNIVTFRDDRELEKGEPIAPELLQAIEGSRVLIVVLSKNYATSTWCLRELEKIVDCIKASTGQRVLPIFLDVSPSEVRKQSGSFAKAFVEHEERFKVETVRRWREALTQVGHLCGWDLCNKPQHGEIEKIVEEVTRTLGHKFSSLSNDLIGMHSRVEDLEKLLALGSNDGVRVVGICGMGGIGKTTLVNALYQIFSHQYVACCFIDNVSKIYGDCGPIGVQKQLLHQVLNEENLQLCSLFQGTSLIRTRLCHVKALIILDNVDQIEQLERLAVNRECLGPGSKIIIVSRDEHILRGYGVDEIYNVQLFNQDEARQLFCKKAFKCDYIKRGYGELVDCVLQYAEGLPLAIKVLGSFLFGRDVSEWRSALARLKEYPEKDVMDVLRISFDGLKETEKEIFLDIACFFIGKWETYVKKVLNCCGFHPDIGIRVLVDRSLITNPVGIIYMHDLLRELGRSIVREKAPKEPGKWSRVWLYDDLHNTILEKTASENLEAIVLQRPENIQEKTIWRAEALSKMSRLRLLILHGVNFSGSLSILSDELRYLSWDEYPFTRLPSYFQPDKLVELLLPHSNIKQLWEGIKPLQNLRTMDLYHSENLVGIVDFRGFPNLERLNLEGCINLVYIDSSIELLQKLAFLNFKDCKSLKSLPNSIFCLNSLEVLNLSGCSKLFKNQLLENGRHEEHLKKLDKSETANQCQSTSFVSRRLMIPFHFFHARRHKNSVALFFPSLPSFPCLRDLDLSFCNLHQIPDVIGLLHFLEKLNLGGNNFVRLPSSIKELPRLINLNLEHCKQLKFLPELPSSTVLPSAGSREYSAGLYIYNCPKLAEIEGCSSMALSWLTQIVQLLQMVQVHVEYPDLRRCVDIVIAGSQIPRWFNHQSVGPSISIEPSPHLHDNNWIGIACCASFVAHDDPTNLKKKMRDAAVYEYDDPNNFTLILKSPIEYHFETEGRGWYYRIPVLIKKDVVMVESAHLWVIYFCREEISNMLSWLTDGGLGPDGVKILIETNHPKGLRLEVKNFGFRWVYKQDLEGLKRTTSHSESSSIQIHDHLGIGGSVLSLEGGDSSDLKQ